MIVRADHEEAKKLKQIKSTEKKDKKEYHSTTVTAKPKATKIIENDETQNKDEQGSDTETHLDSHNENTTSDSNGIAEAKITKSLTQKTIAFVDNDKKELSQMEQIQTDINQIKVKISNLSINKSIKISTKSCYTFRGRYLIR